MRPMLFASLLLVPLALPAAAFASQPATDATTSMHTRRLSTGVTPVRVLEHPKYVGLPSDEFVNGLPGLGQVHLRLNVNREGRAQNIRIVASDDPFLNRPVVAAVRRFRWRPARLDHRTIRVPVNLTVMVED